MVNRNNIGGVSFYKTFERENTDGNAIVEKTSMPMVYVIIFVSAINLNVSGMVTIAILQNQRMLITG